MHLWGMVFKNRATRTSKQTITTTVTPMPPPMINNEKELNGEVKMSYMQYCMMYDHEHIVLMSCSGATGVPYKMY